MGREKKRGRCLAACPRSVQREKKRKGKERERRTKNGTKREQKERERERESTSLTNAPVNKPDCSAPGQFEWQPSNFECGKLPPPEKGDPVFPFRVYVCVADLKTCNVTMQAPKTFPPPLPQKKKGCAHVSNRVGLRVHRMLHEWILSFESGDTPRRFLRERISFASLWNYYYHHFSFI